MKYTIQALALCLLSLFTLSLQGKSLQDYFLPMEPQGPLVSEGIWGAPNVLPRDIKNGLEDPTLENWCYWDGRIVKSDDGRYHLYASRWNQKFSHAEGWKEQSKGMHAVSDNIMGPYIDQGMIWPDWNEGLGHNVVGLRMFDGRYAVVSSDRTPGDIFVSDSPDGPFKHLGEIEVDYNGFDPGLARYGKGSQKPGHMSNVTLIPRPDGRYMIVGRSTAVMISDQGILGPYKIVHDRVYRKYPNLPQTRNEDPTVWYSGGMYHIVYNHWPSKTAYHFTSEDGIHDWIYRGIAYKKSAMPFRYTDGTSNDWTFIERPMAYVENGHVTHFIFSVLDLTKGQDQGNDENGSKIIVVPFDGEAFDRDMQTTIAAEKKQDWTFPFMPPAVKPNRELSAALKRYYDTYNGERPEINELYSQFRYTELKGFDYNGHDGTRNRRDPTKVIFANGKYYVWYTHNHLDRPSNGVPNADIWYATSEDGFTWDEQGPAVERPPKPHIGWSSVLTPDILVWKGKYYLYYQAFGNESGNTKSNPVRVSYADSPDGPWTLHDKIVIPKGKEGEWDHHCIHDPYPLVYKDKIYLYYKSDFSGSSHVDFIRMQGLAIADNPLGPFEKHPLNPLINSGHETTLFPFKEGIAALVIVDGNERSTIQYARDGVNFEIAATSTLMPTAAGPFVPDAFTNTRYGRGITWGLSHVHPEKNDRSRMLMRFDCDLSLDVNDPKMKGRAVSHSAEYHYQYGLDEEQRKRIEEETKKLKKKTAK